MYALQILFAYIISYLGQQKRIVCIQRKAKVDSIFQIYTYFLLTYSLRSKSYVVLTFLGA
jgi:hypothetical protein